MSRHAVLQAAGVETSRWRPGGGGAAALALLALTACHGARPSSTAPPTVDALAALEAGVTTRPEQPRPARPAPPPVDPLQQARIVEAQHIIDEGAMPGRLGRFIAGCASEPACQVARRMALGALRTVRERPERLAALIEAGRAPAVKPEDDPLWPDLVQSLAETWAAANTAAGRKRMLAEKDPRTRLLLVSSLALYAGSNRGLSDLTIPERRVLRAAFMRLYPTLPATARGQVDAFVARIDVNARGTL